MGYFANGFLFTSPPDFEAACKAVPDRSVRAYKHRQHSVWLLDIWKPRGKLQIRRSPFCDPAADGFRIDLANINEAARSFLTAVERLKRAAGLGLGGSEVAAIHVALAVAGATRLATYFFAADDEETDLACNAEPGSLVTFSCRLDRLSVDYVGGRTTVTPQNNLEDGDEEGLNALICAAESVAGVSLAAPRNIDGGRMMYENPIRQWPSVAGDPEKILGFGTWDPLLNLDEDFTIVFEKLSV